MQFWEHFLESYRPFFMCRTLLAEVLNILLCYQVLIKGGIEPSHNVPRSFRYHCVILHSVVSTEINGDVVYGDGKKKKTMWWYLIVKTIPVAC